MLLEVRRAITTGETGNDLGDQRGFFRVLVMLFIDLIVNYMDVFSL